MRYPYERFLRFLVSRKVDVNTTLQRHGLPAVGDIWIAECRTSIRDDGPHALSVYIDSPDEYLSARDGVLEWAEREGFRPLWAMQREFDNGPPPPAYDQAYEVFANPPMRAVLGCLLLSRADDGEIVTLMRDHFGIQLESDALNAYKYIWWDVKNVSRKSWEWYLDKIPNKEERSYLAFGLTSPAANDIRHMLGLRTPVDAEQVVDSIISSAYAEFSNAMGQPHPEAAGAMRWAELALRAVQVKRSGGSKIPEKGDGPQLGDFHNMFSVQPTKSEHVTLSQLHGEVAKRDDASVIAKKSKEAK